MARSDSPSSTPAILVVDDEADIRALARDALGSDGYRVMAVATYDAALSSLRGFRFALVLADTNALAATEEAGRAALAHLLAAAGNTPVVICSGHDPKLFADFAARGFAGTLPKPFDLDELLATVAAHAGPRRRASGRERGLHAPPGMPEADRSGYVRRGGG